MGIKECCSCKNGDPKENQGNNQNQVDGNQGESKENPNKRHDEDIRKSDGLFESTLIE